jgi:cytidylate kinase
MSKQIITISREFGSGGRSVGKRVAELLDIPYYDKELVKKVAVATGFAEEFVERQGEDVNPWKALFSYAFAGVSGPRPMNGLSADDFLWAIQCKVILELADKGPCVIVGRCADYILREREDALHVFIHADMAYRAARIVRLYGESEVHPEKRLEDKDKRRRAYYKHYTGNDWGHYRGHHLSLNTGVVGVERAAQTIVEVARQPIRDI